MSDHRLDRPDADPRRDTGASTGGGGAGVVTRASATESVRLPAGSPNGPSPTAPRVAHIRASDAAFAAYAWGPGGF